MTSPTPSSAEMQKFMQGVKEDMVDGFDDEEVMGEHRTIVSLYRYARTLEARLKQLEDKIVPYALETCGHKPKYCSSQLCRKCYNRFAKQYERNLYPSHA